MDESIRLGRIAGLQVGINWSLLIAFWLIVWSLAGGLLQYAAPGQPQTSYWLAGTAAAMLFYASLLAHELGHAIVARRLGVTVEGITLWLFGGVARLRDEPPSPGVEARIAVVGPAVSLALAVVFGAGGFASGSLSNQALIAVILTWLGGTNLLLAVFNMLPAFPLDGGRVLRAALWRFRGDRAAATRVAASAGRTFGFMLIAAGLLGFVLGLPVSSLWTVFMGWFVLSASRSELSRAQLREALTGLRVADVMSSQLVVAPSYITVEEFLRSYVFVHRYTAYPLKSFDGDIDGLVTVSRLGSVPSDQRRAVRIKDLACSLPDVPTAGPEELVTALLPRLSGCTEGRILVLTEGRLVGIVAPGDITRALHLASLAAP